MTLMIITACLMALALTLVAQVEVLGLCPVLTRPAF